MAFNLSFYMYIVCIHPQIQNDSIKLDVWMGYIYGLVQSIQGDRLVNLNCCTPAGIGAISSPLSVCQFVRQSVTRFSQNWHIGFF